MGQKGKKILIVRQFFDQKQKNLLKLKKKLLDHKSCKLVLKLKLLDVLGKKKKKTNRISCQ